MRHLMQEEVRRSSARLAVSPRQFERQEVATELDCSGTVATVIEADEDNSSDTTSVEFRIQRRDDG